MDSIISAKQKPQSLTELINSRCISVIIKEMSSFTTAIAQAQEGTIQKRKKN